MKNFKSLFIVFAITAIFGQSLGARVTDKGSDFTKKIRSVLNTPKDLKNKTTNEKVTVLFIVNQNGDVIEVNAKTKNTEVKNYLEKQFLTLNLSGLQACVTNSVDVNFTTY